VSHRGEDPRPDRIDVLGQQREEVRLAASGKRLEQPDRPQVEGLRPHHVAVLHHQHLDASPAHVDRAHPPPGDVEDGADRATNQVGLFRTADHADLDPRRLADPLSLQVGVRGLAKRAGSHRPDVFHLVLVDHPAEGAKGFQRAVARDLTDPPGEEDVRPEPDRGADVLEHARLVVLSHLHDQAAHRVGSDVDRGDPGQGEPPPESSRRRSTSDQSAR
jgi:hypothetical protein